MQPLDVITGFDGQPITGTRMLQELVERAEFNRPHSLGVLRDGKPLTLSLKVKPLPKDLAGMPSGGGPTAKPGDDGWDWTLGKKQYDWLAGVLVRSVTVVLPASICAMMPMFRVRASGT